MRSARDDARQRMKKTLSQLKRQREAAQSPPGSKRVCNVATQGGPVDKLRDTTAQLPEKYALLVTFFGHLMRLYLYCRSRKNTCNFEMVQRPVAEAAKRDFTKRHLLQLREIFPDALVLTDWVPRNTCMSPVKMKPQLLIDMPILRKAPEALQDLEQQMAALLLDRVQRHKSAMQRAASKSGSSTSNPAFDLESLPDIPEAELPKTLAGPICTTSRSSTSQSSGSVSTPGSAHSKTPSSSALKPPLGPNSAQRKSAAARLDFSGLKVQKPAKAPSDGKETAGATPVRSKHSHEEGMIELRKQSASGSLPIAQDVLDLLDQKHAEERALFSPQAKAANRQRYLLARLPNLMESLARTVFKKGKPCALPRAEVFRQLVPINAPGDVKNTMQETIDLMLEVAPDYLKQEVREGNKLFLRVDRKNDLTALRVRLETLHHQI